MEKNFLNICQENTCFGCSLCHDLCPVQAIQIKNNNGFYRPVIDEERCIGCHVCVRNCPSNSMKKQKEGNLQNGSHHNRKCYAAWSKDDDRHMESASGGLAVEVAKKFILNGGFVCGVHFNSEKLIVENVIIERVEELEKIAKSKYVQSNKTGIYSKIKELIYDKPCLFIGVPCEVYAFKKFISTLHGKTKETFIIDLLCRGGASPLCFEQHVHNINRKKGVSNITFRGGKFDCYFSAYDSKGKIIYRSGQFTDSYFKSFMAHSIYQEICFKCPFAGATREGDLTLGDFWGLEQSILEKSKIRGCNLVVVNTNKGNQLFESIINEVEFFERSLEETMEENSTLNYPTAKPNEYEKLWRLIKKVGFERAHIMVYGYSKERFKSYIKNMLRPLMKDDRF